MEEVSEEIIEWAKKYKIDQFLEKFVEAGFDTVEVIREMEESDLNWMDITAPGQRKKILLAVKNLPGEISQPIQQQGWEFEQEFGKPQKYVEEDPDDGDLDDEEDLNEYEVGQEIVAFENQVPLYDMPVGRMVSRHFQKQKGTRTTSKKSLEDLCASLLPFLTQGHRLRGQSENPLYTAISNNNVNEVLNILDQIRENKINLNVNDLCGDSRSTPLHNAICHNAPDIVKVLLKFEGVDHRILDSRGRSVLLTAIAMENIEILQSLLEYDMEHSNTEVSENKRENGSLLLEPDSGGRSLLYLACCSDNIALPTSLLQFIPEQQINRKNDDVEQHTPLFAAVTRCDVPLCQLLLQQSADPNIPDALGTTPLMCAVIDHNSVDLVEILLKYDADPTVLDENRMNALDIAAGLDKKQLVEVLLKSEKEHIKAAADV